VGKIRYSVLNPSIINRVSESDPRRRLCLRNW
jgi:hypothetical protein